MTNEEAKKLLIDYNEYRRGNADDFPKPKDIGIAIEVAIQSLDKRPNQYAANIRSAAINWPQYLGDVECRILDAFLTDNEYYCGAMTISFIGALGQPRNSKTFLERGITYMLFVAEALEQ